MSVLDVDREGIAIELRADCRGVRGVLVRVGLEYVDDPNDLTVLDIDDGVAVQFLPVEPEERVGAAITGENIDTLTPGKEVAL